MPNGGFAVPADHKVKMKEIEKRDMDLDLARELRKKKLWNLKVTVIKIVILYSHENISAGTGGLINKRRSGDHPNHSIFEIG